MKKTILTFLVLATFTAGYSQFTQGSILVGGSTNLNFNFQTEKIKTGSTTSTAGKSSDIAFQPQVGYFIIDNFAAGAGLNLTSKSFKQDGTNDKNTDSQIVFAPFARYYFNKFYGQLSFGVGSNKNEQTQGGITVTEKFNVSTWSIGGGYVILLSDAIGLEPQIGYGSDILKAGGNKIISSGPFIRLGVFAYLSKK